MGSSRTSMSEAERARAISSSVAVLFGIRFKNKTRNGRTSSGHSSATCLPSARKTDRAGKSGGRINISSVFTMPQKYEKKDEAARKARTTIPATTNRLQKSDGADHETGLPSFYINIFNFQPAETGAQMRPASSRNRDKNHYMASGKNYMACRKNRSAG